MKWIFILFMLLHSSLLLAQSRRSIRVKAGEDIAQAYSVQGFYRFPQFSKASLFFKGGGKNSGQLLNYNFISGTMQFIGPNRDTLDIGAASGIDSVLFEKDLFLYNNGFMEVAARTDSVLLLKKMIIKTQVENIGAYGQPSQTTSIDKIERHSFGSNVYSFSLNQDVVVVENIFWFLLDRNNNLVKATKSNLLKLLPVARQPNAEAIIRKNKTSFDKEEDLKMLFAEMGESH